MYTKIDTKLVLKGIAIAIVLSSAAIVYVPLEKADNVPIKKTSEKVSTFEKIVLRNGSVVETSTTKAITYSH